MNCKYCNVRLLHKENINSSVELYKKVISLAPLGASKRFNLSCTAEPSIRQDMIDLLELLPVETKDNTVITTNLYRKFTDSELTRLSKCNLGRLNISLDTLDGATYKEITGKDIDKFMDNLERLVGIFKTNSEAPEIRYVSMVFKQNVAEAYFLAQTAFTKYHAGELEFRTPFKGSPEWTLQNAVSDNDWQDLTDKLKELPFNISWQDYAKDIKPQVNLKDDRPIGVIVYLSSVGDVVFGTDITVDNLPPEIKSGFNLNDIENPYEYFLSFT
jgi:wyosine [tRNA(Phe)-imidazoG37] synthetase (radical SAM superfamily)